MKEPARIMVRRNIIKQLELAAHMKLLSAVHYNPKTVYNGLILHSQRSHELRLDSIQKIHVQFTDKVTDTQRAQLLEHINRYYRNRVQAYFTLGNTHTLAIEFVE